MVVREIFDVRVRSGDSPIEALTKSRLRNVQLQQEQQRLRLSAANPSGALDIYKQESALLRALLSDLSALDRGGSRRGDSTRQTFDTPDESRAAKFEADEIKENRKFSDEFKEAFRGYATEGGLKAAKQALQQTDQDPTKLAKQILRTARDTIPPGRAGALAFRTQVEGLLGLEELQVSPQVKRTVLAELDKAKFTRRDSEVRKAARPEELTPEQRRLADKMVKGGGGSVTITRSAGGTQSPVTRAALVAAINRQQARVLEAERRYEARAAEYRRIAEGRNINLATAPLATRPSRQSEGLRAFASLVRTEPDRATQVLEASREAGELTLPGRFPGLTSDINSRAPIDEILFSVESLERLSGYTGPGTVARDLNDEEVQLVRSALSSMLDSAERPLYEGQQIGAVSSLNKTLDFPAFARVTRETIEKNQTKNPELARRVAKQAVTDLSDWRRSQDESLLAESRYENQPAFAVSRSVNRIRNAKKQADEKKDAKILQSAIAKEYVAADKSKGTPEVDTFVKILEDVPRHKNSDVFFSQLDELQPQLELMASNK